MLKNTQIFSVFDFRFLSEVTFLLVNETYSMDDHIFEEDYVLISQGHSETRDDWSEDVKDLGGSVKFMSLVDQRVKALIHSLADHFTTRHQLKTPDRMLEH